MKHQMVWPKVVNRIAISGLFAIALMITSVSGPTSGSMSQLSFGGIYGELFSGPAEARPGGRGARGGRAARRGGRHGTPPKRRAHHRKAHRRAHHRDTRRRAIRRRHALGFLYVATLPRGCSTTVIVDGTRYYNCENVYYRPYVDNGATIYIVQE